MRTAVTLWSRQRWVEWHWQHESGDWWVEIEEIDGQPFDTLETSDDDRKLIRDACADACSLGEYQNDRASGWLD